ncbi:TetR/AcrR family transcriptional regulator [Streptomyces sp. NBC_01190]|uniref:TetR/AcrR family transcriptional regulator n=1 Tax=Streptomyces sp. NBC_01190 TaxID=2903767 RepID=UPI003864737A|nr:TetR/AcrR family transcriptional regulator [Streptomyces sp. NBC_01190]
MTTEVKAPDLVRERILEAACQLFGSRGINATGVDLVSEVAKVSKRSLYQRFPSKDQLIAAYLPLATERFLAPLIPPADSGLSPAAKILAVFAATRRESADAGFRGCPVLKAAAEIADIRHPARGIALSYKQLMEGYFAEQAMAAGATDPALLAEQLVMLFDGALSYAAVRSRPIPAGIHITVRTLLAAQSIDPPPSP